MALKNLDIMEFHNTNQSWNGKQHFSFNGVKLRVHIRRNAYSTQSFARIEVFSPASLTWNVLATIPEPNMKTDVSYVYDKLKPADTAKFKADTDALLEKAKMILK